MARNSKKLAINSLILLGGSILSKGINFIMAPLFTRWLSIEDYGTFDLLATYSMLLVPVLALGIHHGMFRYMLDADSKDERVKIITNSIIINNVGIVCYIIVTGVLVCFFPLKKSLLLLLLILVVSQSIQNFTGMYLRGIKKISVYTITNVICTVLIFLVVTIMLRGFGLQLVGMILGYTIAYLISSFIGISLSKSFFSVDIKAISSNFQKMMLRYSLPLIPNSIAWWILNISDRIVVSTFLGPAENAILAVANKLPNLCISLFDVFQTSWIENITEAINDNDWEAYFNNVINTMARFLIAVLSLIVATNFLVFKLLFTQEYLFGSKLVPLLAIAVVFSSLGQFLGSVFIAEYNSVSQSKTIILAGIINLTTNILLIRTIGLYAAAISTIIAYFALFISRFLELKSKYKVFLSFKTYLSFFVLLVSVVVSYINSFSVNLIVLVLVTISMIIINKDLIGFMMKKILRFNQ